MRKSYGLLLACAVIALFTYAVRQHHNHSDIVAAQNMILTCKSKSASVKVLDGLTTLAGSDGSVSWHTTEIVTSGNSHVSEVEAVVQFKDATGRANKATYYFHINHDTGGKNLDYFDFNGNVTDIREGRRLLFSNLNNKS